MSSSQILLSKFLPALQKAFFAECLAPFLFDQSFLERIILRFEGDLFPADCNSDDAHGLRNLQRPSSHRSRINEMEFMRSIVGCPSVVVDKLIMSVYKVHLFVVNS